MIYQISSGQGPAECELFVSRFLLYLQEHHAVTVLETSDGYNKGTYRSVRIFTEEDLSEYLGSVQWIVRSPYRPEHKRKNWFIDFSACEMAQVSSFDEKDVYFETFRSGGKGGQNVNKVETGVRAIHLPTGRAVVCTEERSQYANKQKAVARLKKVIEQQNQDAQASKKSDNWSFHNQLERGNSKAIFVGEHLNKKSM